MAEQPVIDIAQVIDAQRFGPFLAAIILILSAMSFLDGYDLVAIALAAPSMIREWHVEKALFASVFSAGTFGMAIGCFLFGFIADRWGRRPGTICATVAIGLFSFLTIFAGGLRELIVLRFLTGVGIGGLMPNIYTMLVEFVPHRWRASAVTVVVVVFNLGIILAGFLGAWLIPHYGWSAVYWIAGIAPIVIAGVCVVFLPESPRFLVSKRRAEEGLVEVLRRFDSSLTTAPGAQLVDSSRLPGGELVAASPVGRLFRGRLAVITPLLWASYFFCSVAVFFLVSWTPTLAETLGITPRYAALGLTTTSVGTILASLAMMRFLDWYGAIAIPVVTLLAFPAFSILGLANVGDLAFIGLLLLAGAGVGGGLNGLHSVVGLLYPTECRATGVSWGVAVSRVGGIVGPGFVGILLAGGVSIKGIFLIALATTVIFAVCALGLGWFHASLMREEKSRLGNSEQQNIQTQLVTV